MMNCEKCSGQNFEMAGGGTYAKCKSCKSIYMNMGGSWTPYAIDDSMRAMMEQALGFEADPEFAPKALPVPDVCSGPVCGGKLEKVEKDGNVMTRCEKCGILSRWDGQYLIPVIVEAPGGGWNPEFQALFEEKLGFIKKVKKTPPGTF